MRLHETSGIVLIRDDATGDRAAELNDWLLGGHFAEVLAPGRFVHATRLENPSEPDERPAPRYATVYETNRADTAAAWAENTAENAERRRQGLISPVSPASLSPTIEAFRRVSIHGDPSQRSGSAFVVMVAAPPSDRADFEAWYDGVHIPEILGTGLYQGAVRYELDEGGDTTEPSYLTFYLTASEDPIATLTAFQSSLGSLSPSPRPFQLEMRCWAPMRELGSVAGGAG